MKTIHAFAASLAMGLVSVASAQPARRDTDTVRMGVGYRYQTYYRLSTGQQDTALRCGWHLAFEVPIRGAAIRANHPCGVTVYKTTRDTSGWTQLSVADTVHPLYDDLCYWTIGAFNTTASSNAFDVGWGVYSLTDHITRGDSLYIIRVGNAFKKLWIQRLQGADYFIRVANADGSEDTSYAVSKTVASGKNFVYLNLLTHQVLDLEPEPQNWDLLFTQYSKFLPSPQGPILYNLVGVLLNQGVQAARVRLSSQADPDTLTLSAYPLDSCISVIGDDWKRFDTQSMQWHIADTLYFIVRDKTGNLWRIRFIGFGGSSTGNSIVEKVLLGNAASLSVGGDGAVAVYPQPAQSGIYLLLAGRQPTKVELLTITGQVVFGTQTHDDEALYIMRPVGLPGGVYVLRVSTATGSWTKPIIFE